jgi:DNA-binding GntR family transcriptional regulator
MQAIAPIRRRPLHEEAVGRLRELIVQGRFSPGERLNERLLSQQLGISRTPLREAIKLLASEGLVLLLPNRGAQVAPLDRQRLAETLAVMGALEALAGELACKHASGAHIREIAALHGDMVQRRERADLAGYFRCNQAIHLKIVESSGNATLAHTYRQLNANVLRARYIANLSRERWDEAVREQEKILAALKSRDAVRLKRLLEDHLAHKLASIPNALHEAA